MELAWILPVALTIALLLLSAIALIRAVLFVITIPIEPADIDPKAKVERKATKDKN